MNEDIKIEVEVICPFCKSRIMLRKKKNVSTVRLNCPSCDKELSVSFDINVSPQTYKINEEDVKSKRGKTIYGKTTEKNDDFEEDSSKTRMHRDITRNSSGKYHREEPEEAEETVIQHKRKKPLREKIYLTQLKWFGIKDQKFSLFEGKTVIGRDDPEAPSDISISGDESMSRRSVLITIEDELGFFTYKLKVLNATNKVKVNGVHVKEGYETYLEFGDIITMGNTKFKFDNH